jgi:hypothetical protein
MQNLLKPEDEQEIQRYVTTSPYATLLKEYTSWVNFSIGDVLVKVDNLSDGEFVQVSHSCPVPKKYKIVHIDTVGIPWVKQISVRGGLGKKVKPLIEMQPTRYSFEIDPAKFEADMLGYRYDPRIEYKRMRDVNPNYGKQEHEESNDS